MSAPLPSRLFYLFAACALFLIEVGIARYAPSGSFVRDSLGDVLVIVLLHTILRALILAPVLHCAVLATVCGFVVEGLQYLHVAEKLGFAKGSVMYIVIGNTATWADLLMYVIGGGLAWSAERAVQRLRAA